MHRRLGEDSATWRRGLAEDATRESRLRGDATCDTGRDGDAA